MQRKKKAAEGGADWMGTYGDLVTLLFCFFVLLYSISTVDETKYMNLVKSLNPDAVDEFSQIVTDDSSFEEGEDPLKGSTDAQFEELYHNLVEVANQYQETSDVQITLGDGYQFITFNDSVFFNGDSSVLLPAGQALLDEFATAIAPASDAIQQIHVLGHTSQASATVPNNVYTDRVLSATRAAVVVVYLQEKNIVDPAKLVDTGYGQFHPIDTFETPEGRARNRRVEMIITKDGAVEQALDEYYSEVYNYEVNPDA